MSTTHVAHRAFGLFFDSEESAKSFLADHNKDFDSDGLDEEEPHHLALVFLDYYDEYFLGFCMNATAPVGEFKEFWQSVFGQAQSEDMEPDAYLFVTTY